MLSYNVAALLRSVPGTSRTYLLAVDALPIAEDLELAAPIEGELKLSRTGRSIRAQARIQTSVAERCSRCLIPVAAPINVEIDEEALPLLDIDSGKPLDTSAEPDVLRLDEHHELDLGSAIRDAISLAEPIAPLCRPDCRGLCLFCGADQNQDPGHGHPDDDIDPRLVGLAALRDQLEQ
ncbi:MAG: DUF177 domain-containing protein [Chloroflexi bacterium]|nr:DUF177 domain-containing protein [Chloroflexota bacterium]